MRQANLGNWAMLGRQVVMASEGKRDLQDLKVNLARVVRKDRMATQEQMDNAEMMVLERGFVLNVYISR